MLQMRRRRKPVFPLRGCLRHKPHHIEFIRVLPDYIINIAHIHMRSHQISLRLKMPVQIEILFKLFIVYRRILRKVYNIASFMPLGNVIISLPNCSRQKPFLPSLGITVRKKYAPGDIFSYRLIISS